MTAPPDPVHELTAAHADLQTLESVLRENRVDQQPPGPSVHEYFQDLGTRFWQWILDRFAPSATVFETIVDLAKWIAVAVAVIAATMLLWRLVRFIVNARSAVSGTDPSYQVRALEVSAGGAADDPRAWWSKLQSALTEGRFDIAATALWWWTARSLAGDEADESWTSRDLANRRGRPGLAEALRRLDAAVYGPAALTADDLEDCATRLRFIVDADTELLGA